MRNKTETVNNPRSDFFDRPGLARFLNVKISLIDDLVCRRTIPFVRLGHRTVRFRRADIEKWLDARTFDPNGEGDGR